jgi:hypothetical protein
LGSCVAAKNKNREGDLGGSPGFGWTWRPKADNILLVRWGVIGLINLIIQTIQEGINLIFLN